MNNTLEHRYDLLGQAVLLPIPLGKKGPVFEGWKNCTFAMTQTPDYQKRLQACVERGGNIGVLLGPESGHLHAVDVDQDGFVLKFMGMNPWIADTMRSKGKNGCQFWLRPAPGTSFPNWQAFYPLKTAEGQKWGEWRCGPGAQSVIFGRHPDGPDYQIVVERHPLEADFARLKWPVPETWNQSEPPPTQPGGVAPVTAVQDNNRFRRNLCEVKIPIQFDDSLHSQFAEQLGKLLAPHGFFERGASCVELEYDYKLGTYQLTPADDYGFCTDIETACSPFVIKVAKKTGKKSRSFRTIPLVLSRTVLASKFFVEQLRPLLGFNAMRVPVRRATGQIEPLPEGYDSESKILTVSTPSANYIKAAELLTPSRAREYLRDLLSEFCFQKDDRGRAESVAVSAMLTLFCRELLGPRIQKPGFVYSANAEGAGKTLLAKLAIIPHLGYCPAGTVPKDEDEMRKCVFAVALADSAVLFLDNCKGYLSSARRSRPLSLRHWLAIAFWEPPE